MKKFLSILLVFAFSYSFIGYYLNFEIEQYLVKEEVKENILNHLPVNQLILIKISSGNHESITWTELGKEFRFSGTMYDVIKSKVVNDTSYFYCYNDTKESKLLANLDKLVKDQANNSKSKSNQKKQEIIFFYQIELFSQNLSEKPVQYFIHSVGFASILTDVLSPPPKAITFLT
jgi:hypothetical protein